MAEDKRIKKWLSFNPQQWEIVKSASEEKFAEPDPEPKDLVLLLVELCKELVDLKDKKD
ncbi:MAG: hypothetical protein GTN82_15645 [Candidatus Aminicenantes bacterium]|nr:hypothetical protein [Candidatus Aminicenantes bacterium]